MRGLCSAHVSNSHISVNNYYFYNHIMAPTQLNSLFLFPQCGPVRHGPGATWAIVMLLVCCRGLPSEPQHIVGSYWMNIHLVPLRRLRLSAHQSMNPVDVIPRRRWEDPSLSPWWVLCPTNLAGQVLGHTCSTRSTKLQWKGVIERGWIDFNCQWRVLHSSESPKRGTKRMDGQTRATGIPQGKDLIFNTDRQMLAPCYLDTS